MNFKTETTFEGRVLNGKIVNNKVVLDELFGVSLINEVKLDSSQIYQLIGDLNTIHNKLNGVIVGKDSLKIEDKSVQGVVKTCNLSSKPITVDDINSLSYFDLIETIGKRLEVLGKNNSTKLI